MKNIKNYWVLILTALCFIVFLNQNCKESGTRPEDIEFVLPDSNLSFIDDIKPMFEAKCGFGSDCHSPENTESRLLYITLISRMALLDHELTRSSTDEKLVNLALHIQNPEAAPLYRILKEGYPPLVNDQMPPLSFNRSPLNENQLNSVKQWIKEGAKD